MSNPEKSPLQQTILIGPTDFWNDSCSITELTYAIEHGAVGATSNPVIVGQVLKQEINQWNERISSLIAKNPTQTEIELTWQLIEEIAVKATKLLEPVFHQSGGRTGRLSIQTNPQFWTNTEKMVEQARYLSTIAPNIQVKIPVTAAGIQAIEDATYFGVNINATVCFSVAQAIAVAEAVYRAYNRRKQDGISNANLHPVCTIMVGRVDDWLKVSVEKQNLLPTPGVLDWAGVAVMKKAYGIFKERKYSTRLLAAAFRHHLHWSEFIGGDLILTIPYSWQKKINQSSIKVESRIDRPVDPQILKELQKMGGIEFSKMFESNGMQVKDFDAFGATRRTLRNFLTGYDELIQFMRNRMIPNPDV